MFVVYDLRKEEGGGEMEGRVGEGGRVQRKQFNQNPKRQREQV